MCKECGRIFCPDMCPNYAGYSAERGEPRGSCDLCEQRFYQYDPVYRHGKRLLCEDCHRLYLAVNQSAAGSADLQSLPFGIDL